MTHFKEGFTFTWKVENFSMLLHEKDEMLVSPIFIVESLKETRWCLYLYPKGVITNERDNYLSLFLNKVTFGITKLSSKVNYAIALESVDSAFEKSMSEENVDFDIEPQYKGFSKFQELKIMYDNKNIYLPQDILTISCHIWPSQEKCQDPAVTMKPTSLSNYFEKRCSAKTSFDVQKRSFTWPFKKINELEKSQEKISIFLDKSLEDSPSFKLSFCIDKNLNAEHAQIEILPTSSELPLFVKCKITVVNGNKDQHSQEDSHLFSSFDEVWHFPGFILIDNLTSGKYTYIDNTMFLQCKLTYSCIGNEYSKEVPMFVPNVFQVKEASESNKLNKNIFNLFESKKLCDVELRISEEAFPCHKLVICAQSPVFDAMFENDMKEKESGVVEITDLEPQTLQKMLKFLYTEVIEDGLTTEEICKLYSAADRYEVLPLQQGCSLLLLSTLSVTSICSVLALADIHQDQFLWTLAYDFLSINSKEVFHSPQWKTFMLDYPTLSRDTMFKLCMEEPY